MNFYSDNVAGAAPEILAALAEGAAGSVQSYGADPATARVERRLAEIFETEIVVFPVATGTAANALALAALCPPYGAVYCHAESHVQVDECGAPEFYTGGAKLVPLAGAHGRIAPADLERALAAGGAGDVHHVQPAALSIGQLSEAGTAYTPGHVAELADVARRHGLGLHMDGARFANALVGLGCTPAELTWKAGVDVLSFGATKNGCLAAEALVFFKPGLAREIGFRRKRAGHLFSKMRFLSLQLEAYLADDLWLRLAGHANAMAARLAEGLAGAPGVEIAHPVDGNQIFVALPPAVKRGLRSEGFGLSTWDDRLSRLVCAFNTEPA
ncbi:MAG: low specificity L-threonine aldolase, partial [Inquilinus sp.]|nr:low specificity L-threonine aldolase [Inquilinus sp.]